MDKFAEMVLAGLVAAAFGIAGFLLKKFFDTISESFVEVNQKLDEQADQLSGIKTEVNGYKLLAQYQEARIVALESKNDSLQKSHAAIDKQIGIAIATGALSKPRNNN